MHSDVNVGDDAHIVPNPYEISLSVEWNPPPWLSLWESWHAPSGRD